MISLPFSLARTISVLKYVPVTIPTWCRCRGGDVLLPTSLRWNLFSHQCHWWLRPALLRDLAQGITTPVSHLIGASAQKYLHFASSNSAYSPTPNRSIAVTEVRFGSGKGEREKSLLQLAYLSLPISTSASPFHVRNRRHNIKRSTLSASSTLRSLQFDVSSLLGILHPQAPADGYSPSVRPTADVSSAFSLSLSQSFI